MFRLLLSFLGLLVLLAIPAAGSTAWLPQPTAAAAPAVSAPPNGALTDHLTPPAEGGRPYDPAALRPDQPYPSAEYPGQRVARAAPAGWSPAAAPPSGIDLDVTFISRAPMYRSYCIDYPNGVPGIPILCPGTEEERRWPAAGEVVTFTAHIVNKGTLPSPAFDFKWFIDGSEVASGTLPGLASGAEATAAYAWPWAHTMDGERVLDDHTVRFIVDPADLVHETFEANNSLEDRTNALGFRIGITPEMVAAYSSPWLPDLSYSAEDWLQRQIAAMNWVFANSIYPLTPGGATERVRINSIEVTATPPVNNRSSDGGWFVDADYRIVSAWYDPTTDIDWALVHELSHQVGVIDLYQLNLSPLNVRVLDREKLPANFGFEWPRPDLMGGGDIAPHTDSHLYSSHGAAGFSSTKGYRRGYYGEYQFDIPRENTIRVLDSRGDPATGVEVSLYQRNGPIMWPGEVTVDDIPEFTGMTDGDGRVLLANRQIIGGPWATRTGHVLRDNPFGVVDVVGGRNRFLLKLGKGAHEEFAWLDITDFNLAYWAGDTESHTFTVQSHVPPPAAPAPPQGLTAQLATGRVTLNWNGTAIPEVNGYYVYAAAAPIYTYEKISGRVTGTSYVVDYNDSDRIYVVTAVDLDGRESGFSRTAWIPVLVTPSAVIIPDEERLILDTHAGPLIRQDGSDRYLGRLGQHFGDTGDRYLAADAGGRLLVTSPERQKVSVTDPNLQPLFEFGSEGAGPGQFLGPAGVAAWGSSCSVEGPHTSDAHTLLLLHFDIGFTGADSEIGTPNGAGFAEGRYSGGLYIDHADTLTYETSGNLNRAQGAIEFWVQPKWEGDDGENHVFFEAGTEWFNRIMITKDGANNLRLIVWDSAHEYGVAYGIGDWRAGEWHHVAATWDASSLALYVDGQRRDRTGNARPPDALASWFAIGSTAAGGSQADAVIDEFRISDTPRVGNSDTCSRILVADSGNDRIQAFDALGGFVSAYGSTGSGPDQFRDPQGLAVDDGGRVIVADRGNNRLQLLRFDGVNFSGLFDVQGLFNGPTGVAAYGSDSILVADTGNNAIKLVIPREHLPIIEELPTGQQGPLSAPRGVAASGSDGNLIVADTSNRRIVTVRGVLPTLTPTPAISPTPTPTITRTPTATRTPSPTPPTPAPACQEMAANGGFEEDAAWDFPVTASRGGYTTAEAHTGIRSARLGMLPGPGATVPPQPTPCCGRSATEPPPPAERNLLGELAPENASFSAVHQTIRIPPNAGAATLRFWYQPGSQAAGGDYQRVMLLDPNGYTYIATLMQVLENADSWRQASFDLTPYRGRQVDLYFEVFNDNISAGPRAWMFLDDISVLVCSVTPPPPWTPTPTPSPTPGGDLTVMGFVYDASNERPIVEATVSAQMCVPRAYSALTGTDGRYSLLIPGPELDACAEITINALAPGYGPTGRRTIVAELRRNPEVDFGLIPLPAILVTTTDDELNTDGDCSLREAIQAIHTHQPVDECRAGRGGDTIAVPAGVYRLTLAGAGEDANLTGDLDIHSDLKLIGAGIKGTVIDGAGLDRVLDVHGSAAVQISGLMIAGGRTPDGIDNPVGGGDGGRGGGIMNSGDLILSGCGVSGNRTGDGGDMTSGNYTGGQPGGDGGNGGGIYNAGALQLVDSWIANNTTGGGGMGGDSAGPALAGAGGGIYNVGKLALDRTTVERNRTGMGGTQVLLQGAQGGPGGDGGGIYNAGDAAITRSSVADNQAGNGQSAGTHGGGGIGGAGGGIYNKGELLLRQSTVSGNTSGAGGSAEVCAAGGHGGGIAGTNGALRLANSTVSGNRTGAGGLSFVYGRCAGGNGGGIYVVYGAGLDNTTIAANHANGAGGGFFIVEQYVSLRNTILAGNTASEKGPNCGGNGVWSSLHLIGHNLTQDHTGCLAIMDPADGPNIFGKDPLLLPLGKYGGPTLTHALSLGSPAIDAGSCTDMRGDPVTEDQRGVTRPQGAICDIGAFEGGRASIYLPLILAARRGAVSLLYFRATPQNGNAILLEWETATELDTAAFNLYRSQDPASLGQSLAVLPAQGNAVTGAAYSYRDSDVVPGVLYNYTLTQVTTSGELIAIAAAGAGIEVTPPPTPTRSPTPTAAATSLRTPTATPAPATGDVNGTPRLDTNGDGLYDTPD